MRFALLVTLSLLGVGICRAPSAASLPAAPDPQNTPTPDAAKGIEKRSERIHIEDAGSSIDELRVGGETLRISVQPKGGMPTYQIAPGSGERSWKILSF